jgi:hypothetical protein
MPTKPIDKIRVHVAPFVTKCPVNIQEHAIRDAFRRFAEGSELWAECVTMASVADQEQYDVANELDYDSFILRVVKVLLDDTEVNADHYTMDADGLLSFIDGNEPQESGDDIDVYVILLPSDNWKIIPDYFPDQWGRVIAAGALADLKLRTGTPYFDPDGAMIQQARFDAGIGNAKGVKVTKRKDGNLKFQHREFI